MFIVHNVHHAYPIGDGLTILNRGRSYGAFEKNEVAHEEVAWMMAGGEDMEDLSAELAEFEWVDAEKARREGRTLDAASSTIRPRRSTRRPGRCTKKKKKKSGRSPATLSQFCMMMSRMPS